MQTPQSFHSGWKVFFVHKIPSIQSYSHLLLGQQELEAALDTVSGSYGLY